MLRSGWSSKSSVLEAAPCMVRSRQAPQTVVSWQLKVRIEVDLTIIATCDSQEEDDKNLKFSLEFTREIRSQEREVDDDQVEMNITWPRSLILRTANWDEKGCCSSRSARRWLWNTEYKWRVAIVVPVAAPNLELCVCLPNPVIYFLFCSSLFELNYSCRWVSGYQNIYSKKSLHVTRCITTSSAIYLPNLF